MAKVRESIDYEDYVAGSRRLRKAITQHDHFELAELV